MKYIILFLIAIIFSGTSAFAQIVEIGQKAPDFELIGYNLKPVKLDDFKGKNLVLFFVPGAFTGVCTKELCSFQSSLESYNKLDASVVCVTVDSPFSNKNWAEKNNVKYPVLSDYSRKTIIDYGVTLENFAGMKGYTAPQRSLFIMDKEGIVRFIWIADNAGMEPDYKQVEQEVAKLKQ